MDSIAMPRPRALPIPAAAPQRATGIDSSPLRSAFLFFMLFNSQGFPFAVAGLPLYYGGWLSAAIVLSLSCYYLLARGRSLDGWDRGLIALMGFYLLVSAISNSAFFPKPVGNWLPAFFGLAPLWLSFPLKAINCSSRDISNALFAVGVVAGLILLADHFAHFPFMDVYQRAATTDTSLRRVVFLKSECAFAILVTIARIGMARGVFGVVANGVALAVQGFALYVVSESRLAIAASLMAIALFALFVLRGRRAAMMVAAGLCCAIVVIPLVLGKYIDQIERIGDYSRQDGSVKYRLIELDYFYDAFEKTYGIGFGVMSSGVDPQNQAGSARNNPIAYGNQIYGVATGTDYGLYLADMGIMGALVQFGYAGLAIVLWITLRVSFRLMRIGRVSDLPSHKEAGAVGALIFCYLLSPWPTNLFSMDWSAPCGGVAWFLASCCTAEFAGRRRAAAATAALR